MIWKQSANVEYWQNLIIRSINLSPRQMSFANARNRILFTRATKIIEMIK